MDRTRPINNPPRQTGPAPQTFAGRTVRAGQPMPAVMRHAVPVRQVPVPVVNHPIPLGRPAIVVRRNPVSDIIIISQIVWLILLIPTAVKYLLVNPIKMIAAYSSKNKQVNIETNVGNITQIVTSTDVAISLLKLILFSIIVLLVMFVIILPIIALF